MGICERGFRGTYPKHPFRLFDFRDVHPDLSVSAAQKTLHEDRVGWLRLNELKSTSLQPFFSNPGATLQAERGSESIQDWDKHLRGLDQTSPIVRGAYDLLRIYTHLVQQVYGAQSTCHFFSPMWRAQEGASANKQTPVVHFASFLHSDFSFPEAQKKVEQAGRNNEDHTKIVSIWIPLKPGHPPLAAIPHTLVNPRHVYPSNGLLAFGPEPKDLGQYNLWYISDQQTNEVTMLEMYDSEKPPRRGPHMGAPHGSPQFEGMETVETRESFEVRAVIHVRA